MSICWIIRILLKAIVKSRASLVAENVALRQQLAVLERKMKRPRLRNSERIFWVWLSRLWKSWPSALLIVQPETVIKWHRQGFRLYWRFKSRKKKGRPKIEAEIRILIRRMSRDNPTWGAPRILSELLLLGYSVAESTVAKYMVRTPKPPSQTWRSFLKNHVGQIAAIDFFTVPTISFRVLYVFLVLLHCRRRIVHFNITTNPTAQWTAQQVVEAFPYDEAPRFLLRDRDGTYGELFQKRVKHMGIEEVLIAPRAPWQNPFAERIIGSIRRDCLDRMIVLNEDHLYRILSEYFSYYHKARAHLSLERNSPIPRSVQSLDHGKIVSKAYLGGLHHCYSRAA